MKHIVLYSGGANSAAVSFIVAKQHPQDTILLHTPTFAEHPDADRFRAEFADRLNLGVTVAKDGRDLWQLIEDENCLPSHFIPFCTRKLKHEPMGKYLKALGEDFTLYVGYDSTEWRRVQKQSARFESLGYKSSYPLADISWTGCDAKQLVDSIGVELPEPYTHLNHNNCLPCFKGGLGHFWSIWRFYPEYFAKAVHQEKVIGHTVFKTDSLSELARRWAAGERPKTAAEDGIPCLCAV